jgi:hypothetical protein
MRGHLICFISMAVLLGATQTEAGTYSIGNAQPTTVFFVEGESFTPSVQGNAGTGTPIASPSGTVLLTSFTIDFQNPATAPTPLYIYAFEPTVAEAAVGTGSLATGSYAGGGVYDFSTPVNLTFTTKYFAVLPTSASIFDGDAVNYPGGIDLYPQNGIVQEGALGQGVFDIGFAATFNVVPEPSTGALAFTSLLTLVLLAAVRAYNSRRVGARFRPHVI